MQKKYEIENYNLDNIKAGNICIIRLQVDSVD